MKRAGRWRFDVGLRRLFNFAAAVSVVLCVASVIFWVRSYTWKEGFSFHIKGVDCTTFSRFGGAALLLTSGSADSAHFQLLRGVQSRIGGNAVDYPEYSAAGFGFLEIGVRNDPTAPRTRVFIIPFWFLTCVAAILPALSGWSLVRRHRSIVMQGLCKNCGYDLRATPDRCPECGAIPPAAKGATL